MNKLTKGEEFLREQISSFEFPYDESAWLKMDRALPRKKPGNFLKWASGFAVFTAAVVAVVYFSSPDSNPVSKQNTTEQNITVNPQDINTNNNSKITETLHINNTSSTINNSTPSQTTYSNNKNTIMNPAIKPDSATSSCISKNENITENLISRIPCADFTLSSSSGCPPFTVQFTPDVKCDSMIYSWDFGDGKISTEKQPAHTFEKAGKYTVRLTVKYFRSEEIKTKVIENAVTVYAKPKAKFDVIVDENKVMLQTAMTNHTFTWIANDTVSQGATADRMMMRNGTHTVTFIAQNPAGCTDTASKKVTINVPLIVYMPNAFSPNNDGQNDSFGPVSENDAITQYQLEIINAKGLPVYSRKGLKVDWDGINTSTRQPCEPGTYHYKLKIWDKFGNFEERNGMLTLKQY